MALHTARRLGLVRSASTDTAPSYSRAAALVPARSAHERDPRALEIVYRACFILETNIKQLSLDVWRGSTLLPESDIPSILLRPHPDMTRSAFNAETIQSLAQRGNAFWLIRRSGPYAKDIISVEILDPLRVHAWRDERRNETRYAYDGRDLRTSDLIHLKLTHQPGEVLGLGPVQAAMSTVRAALATRELADTWHQAPGTGRGVLSTDQDLSADQAARYSEQIRNKLTAENGIAVLGKGLNYQALRLTPSELQFLESQEADALKLARLFGLSQRQAMTSVKGSSLTYANIESEKQLYLTDTFMSYLSEIEAAYSRLAPTGQTVRFNVDAFLRPDTSTRYQAHKIGIDAGFLTIDEVRQIEGLPPLTTTTEPARTTS